MAHWISIDVDMGKIKGTKKILMRHDENIAIVAEKFAIENGKLLFVIN